MRLVRRCRTSWLALVCASLVMQGALFPGAARAQTASHRAGVQVRLCAAEGELQPLERALHDVIETFEVSADLRLARCERLPDIAGQEPGPADSLARIFIDTRGTVAKLYIVDERNGNVLLRRVPRTGVSLQVVHEQLAEIVRASLDTLLEGGSLGAPPANKSRSRTEQTGPRRAARRSEIVDEIELPLGLYYAASAYAAGASILHGPGLFAELNRASRGLGWVLGGSAEYRFLDQKESSALLHLDVIPLRLFAGASTPVGPGRLQLALGAGADLIRVAPGRAELSDEVADSRWLATTVFRAQARLSARVSERVSLFSLVALDADPSATRYVVTLDGEQQTFLSPWSLRPSVGLGISL